MNVRNVVASEQSAPQLCNLPLSYSHSPMRR